MVNSRTVPGWKLNVDNGRWNHPESKLECNYEYNGGWIGYTNSGDGSISTTLNAIGQTSPVKGKLKFANCYINGEVVAYLETLVLHLKQDTILDKEDFQNFLPPGIL